jgi:hypothetical protein
MPDPTGQQRHSRFRPELLWKGADRDADRRVGDALTALLDPDAKAEVAALIARGDKVTAVRRVRQLTGVRLLDATRLVDSLQP